MRNENRFSVETLINAIGRVRNFAEIVNAPVARLETNVGRRELFFQRRRYDGFRSAIGTANRLSEKFGGRLRQRLANATTHRIINGFRRFSRFDLAVFAGFPGFIAVVFAVGLVRTPVSRRIRRDAGSGSPFNAFAVFVNRVDIFFNAVNIGPGDVDSNAVRVARRRKEFVLAAFLRIIKALVIRFRFKI